MARRPLGEPLFSLEAGGACLLVILCWTWYRRRMLAFVGRTIRLAAAYREYRVGTQLTNRTYAGIM